MASMSVSGIVSGMDWEGMIDEIITNAAKPAQVKVNKKTNLTNKKSLFEEMKVTMNSLQSSLSPLKLPSTYKAKTIDIERIDKNTSYKGVLTATANADAEVNVWDLTVNQLATAQINRSKQINDSNLTSTLNGVSGKTIYINAGGQKVGVEVKSSDTLESLKSRINTTLKTLESPIYVTASVVDNKLLLKSDYTGLGTMTGRETINYNYSTGINRLSNLSIPEEAYDNVKITSSGKSYTIHKDFEIANGNEIRWKQYDRGNEVALNDTVNVKYTMAAGDQYKNDKGVYGTSEITIENFNVKDFGTLASRATIVDEDNKTYTYGKDFTINSSGKVVWLEEKSAKTNEPSSYTVSYNKDVTITSSISGKKVNPTTTLASECTVHIPMSATVTFNNSTLQVADTTTPLTYSGIESVSNALGLSTVIPSAASLYSGSNYVYYINGNENNVTFKLTDDSGVEYIYGKDFVLMSEVGNSPNFSNDGTLRTARTTASSSLYVDKYKSEHGITGTSTPIANGNYTLDVSFDKTLSATDVSSVNFKTLTDNLGAADLADFTITVNGTTYKYGESFTVNDDGTVTLTDASTDDDISSSDWDDFETKYREISSLSDDDALPLLTLTDANGVLRTYFDPEDPSLFTMQDTTTGDEYEYGRDYVIRVNDSGDGYVFAWAIPGDKDNDGKITIKDADTAVTTYTQKKNISTLGIKAAPAVDDNYAFNYTGTITTSASATVSSSATYKSLAKIFSDVSIDSSDYSTIQITDSAGTTYNYGIDFKIDSSGNIEWLDVTPNKPADTDTFTVSYGSTVRYSSTYSGIIGNQSNVILNVDRGDGNGTVQVLRPQAMQIINSSINGEVLYASQYDANGDPTGTKYYYDPSSTWGINNSAGHFGVNWTNYTGSDRGAYYKMFYERTDAVTSSLLTTADDTYSVLSLTGTSTLPADIAEKLTITNSNGTTYTYGKDFTVNDDGTIHWVADDTPKHPTGAYTLTYDAFSAITAAGTTDGNTTQEVAITVNSGYGNYGGDKRSYEQILSDTGLTSSSSSDDWAKYFTLATTDGTTTYTYGTDYTIIQGNTTDSSTGEHNVMINWINAPASGTSFKLTYGTDGGETISTSVTRDASDTLSVAYNDIKSSTVTITQGSKTYYEGVDFELSGDSSNVVVTWKSDKKGGYEWYYPNPGSSYSLNVEDSNGTKTTYSGRRTSSASLNFMSDDYGMTTARGSISVHYGDDDDHSYRLDAGADSETGYTGYDVIKGTYGIDITPTTGGTYTFNWVTPKLTTHSNLPSMNDELTVEYQYDANTFDLSDDGDGDLLYALGFTKSDGSYDDYTKAQGAEIVLNGETIEVDSNDIGADYDNEIIKGVTLHLKGTGEVTMDISHDAEKAVESIQSFVDNYNDLMTWMNTRMTEKQLDEDTAATVDSDDFRMRWGLLHGNSLLRQTKSQMRSLTSKNFTFTFTQRKSSEEIYGSMAFNGLKTASTLRLRIGSKYVDITIDPSDTLETIVAKLSDDTKNGPMHDFYYDENGQKLQSPLIKASVENDKLEIHSTDNQEITMSGSAAMNALKMNYTYKGLYQIGIESTSDDYGKSGELVFDTDEFMTALEDNPDEVQALMTSFVSEFSAWTSSMLSTSASGETKGTLTREIDNIQSQIDTINEYLERYQERLDRMEENLRTRYGNTETQFSKLSQQANSIAAILNQLNGTASGGGYGQASS